jgi:hypothetical protein
MDRPNQFGPAFGGACMIARTAAAYPDHAPAFVSNERGRITLAAIDPQEKAHSVIMIRDVICHHIKADDWKPIVCPTLSPPPSALVAGILDLQIVDYRAKA